MRSQFIAVWNRLSRIWPKLFSLLVLTLAMALAQGTAAQEGLIKSTEISSCAESRCGSVPNIDGELSEGEWDQATLISDLYQVRPNEFAPPSQNTEFLVQYDENNLYIAAKVYESDPNLITARTTRQGADISDDDGIRVFIDPYNSKRAGYIFALNPNEVRNEGIYLNITILSSDWTAIWQGQAQLTEYGWSAEMAIPFKTLTFSEGNENWGFNVYRYIARENELAGWVSQNRSDNASISGTLTGIRGMNQGVGLDVVPSLSFTDRRTYNPNEEDTGMEPSVDLFYKITPSLNGALTFNTDFSAAEVDDRQVGLTQFNLFFPEKRAFFLREFDVFDFGGIGGGFSYSRFFGGESQNARPFFSRNIGLSSNGTPVDINAGAKISGRIGNYDVGLLAVRQDEFTREGLETVDASSLLVGRVVADVFEESSLGAIFTSGDPKSNLDSSLAGVDFRYRNSQLGAGKRVDANIWYQQSGTEGVNDKQSAFGAMFSMPNSVAWRGLAQYQRVEENFDPALGFVSRSGVELNRGTLGYIWRFDDHPLLRLLYSGIDLRRWSYLEDGRKQTSTYHMRLIDLETNEGDSFEFGLLRYGEGVYSDANQPLAGAGIILPLQEYTWDRWGFALNTSRARPVDLSWSFYGGDFYGGERPYHQIGIGWRPTGNFRISTNYVYWDVDLPEGSFDLRQLSASTEWAFSSSLSWVNVFQYDNISRQLGINSRLHWTPRAGQDAYFVINHNYDEIEDGRFESTRTDLTAKFNYTFRF